MAFYCFLKGTGNGVPVLRSISTPSTTLLIVFFSLRSIQKLPVNLPPSLTKSRRKMLSLRSNALIVGLPGWEPPAEPAVKKAGGAACAKMTPSGFLLA